MPRKTEWIHRLDSAIAALEALPSPVVDSAALATLLGITPRHARRVFGRLFEQPAGRSCVALRLLLLERLRALATDPGHLFEIRRRDRVEAQLETVRRHQRAHQVKIAPPSPVSGMAGLPASIRLEPGLLEIRFRQPEELLTHLLSLAQAISEDFERFATSLESPAR